MGLGFEPKLRLKCIFKPNRLKSKSTLTFLKLYFLLRLTLGSIPILLLVFYMAYTDLYRQLKGCHRIKAIHKIIKGLFVMNWCGAQSSGYQWCLLTRITVDKSS